MLEKKVETRGTAGGVSTTWKEVEEIFAGIEPLHGREFLAAQQTQNETTVQIVLRYYPGLDNTWRVRDIGSSPEITYTIDSVINENNRDRMVTLMCKEGPKSG
jgi:SPP1 family predicted phage head-tail adaptor